MTVVHRPQANHSRNPMLGIAMVLAAVLLFASMDSATKYLSLRYDVAMVLTFRFGIGVLLMLVFVLPRLRAEMVRWRNPKAVLARSAITVASSMMTTCALRWLPVAETTAIVYLAPFGVLLLAGPVLGETVNRSSWLAALAGFLGLMLILRPGGGLDPVGIAFALGAALTAMGYYLFTRSLAATESTAVLLFGANLVGFVAFGSALPWVHSGAWPQPWDLWIFGYAGVAGLVGHYLLTAAYREATAGLLAPMTYAHLVWAGLLGWLVFGEVPGPLSILGIAVIVLSGAGLAVWTRIMRRRTA